MIASASAPSVPGIGAMWRWHFSAVSERYGSMATSVAPRRLASWARVQKWRFEAIGLPPQMMTSLASATYSMSMPTLAP
ncbi:hypothetical protein D3C81_1974180 [compost metagenome]